MKEKNSSERNQQQVEPSVEEMVNDEESESKQHSNEETSTI